VSDWCSRTPARQVRGGPDVQRPPLARGGGRPHLVRPPGLISAIERFEPEREIKFETFAITRIKGSIIDELRSLDWVPRSVRTKAREIERANAKLEHELHRAPDRPGDGRAARVDVEEFQESLVRISNSSVVALDELWTVSDASATRSPCSTRSRIPRRSTPPWRWTRPR
jgi:DNA-directed RNA polymerase specialized sigma subunit